MLMEFLQAALRHAKCEILSDDGTFYGEIPECAGVYANAQTLEGCREELRQVLEEWVLFRINKNLSLPIIDGIEPACGRSFDASFRNGGRNGDAESEGTRLVYPPKLKEDGGKENGRRAGEKDFGTLMNTD